MGAGLFSLTVASRVGGATAANEHSGTASIIKVIVPPSAEISHAAAAPSAALPSSAAFSEAPLRFGFLEFEDDADAPSR
jgi:hypothetical protein